MFNAESRRKPGGLTVFNDADNIKRYLQADAHKIWGWVIYRSTYDSEDDWNEFLSCLRTRIKKNLKRCDGLDMLGSLDHKIFEDRALFDGASTSKIREHFRAWTASASIEEQGAGSVKSQRYQFCI
ncbi:hypothetical protein K431DRAFT_223975 [Polychaeton citri CBS 116435]|uniref:Uncharacterized protein n=1 Tax=Polychaeton citri CBS 116435 TaxID=1314669 RepID=A0A9P4QB95_9PEZI|nr:hypothetical protein K431DRAFT_223975 [Polychaeton citri CBS 116435]